MTPPAEAPPAKSLAEGVEKLPQGFLADACKPTLPARKGPPAGTKGAETLALQDAVFTGQVPVLHP
jgi:hypothetical protein